MDDDEIMRIGALAQNVGDEVHIRLSIRDKFTRTWQANEGENRKCAAPELPARGPISKRGIDADRGKDRQRQKIPDLRRHFRKAQKDEEADQRPHQSGSGKEGGGVGIVFRRVRQDANHATRNCKNR